MWREPSEADALKSPTEKDPTATARSSIRRTNATRRPSSYVNPSAGRRLFSFHTQPDELQRGVSDRELAVRSPVLNVGFSEDGLDLDAFQREALHRVVARTHPSRRREIAADFGRRARERQDYLSTRSDAQSRNRPHLTPGFAPAVAHRASSSPHQPLDGIHLPPLPLPSMRSSETRHYNGLAATTLRDHRTGNALSRAPRDSTVDGLGDRQRSLSPDGERENDAWETLLSTITPDASQPSNDTSFSSNTAADIRRNATTLASTMLPPHAGSVRGIRLRPDLYPDDPHPCDYLTSEEDDDDSPADYHRFVGPSSIPLPPRRSSGMQSTMSSQPPIPTISLSFSDSGETDLRQMQAILDRLARREDIPDDWWAGAGLSRTIGRGLEAGAGPDVNDRNE